jgi:hypothetical protein
MSCLALVAVAAALLAGCRSPGFGTPRPQRVEGRVEGATDLPADAHVAVYRMDEHGLPVPLAGERPVPDARGAFATSLMAPGRYVLALRSVALAPSLTTVSVPPASPATLRAHSTQRGLELSLALAGEAPAALEVRLTEARTLADVPDRRECVLAPGEARTVRYLAPGLWRLDLPALGATADVALWRDDAESRRLELTAPAATVGSEVFGVVIRLDGSPAPGVAVTVRPMRDDGGAAEPWGRYALTDAAGHFRVAGVRAGEALVRVETRDVPYALLPPPRRVRIPPSGTLEMGFLVRP